MDNIRGEGNMNDVYSSSAVSLAHILFEISNMKFFYASLAVMSLFVFGPLLFRKFIRMPKGLFISSLISYVLILIIILCLSFRSRTTNINIIIVSYACFVIVFPNLYIVGFIEVLLERFFGSGFYVTFDQTIVIYLVTFIMNTLYIFVITRLILYIKHKVSVKKTQVKQAV
jgi:hypothetical protein